MAVKDGIRRRKGEKSDVKGEKDEKPATKEANLCRKLIWISFLLNCAVAGFLYYAYKTSPISPIAIDDIHDMLSLKWTHVNNSDLQRGQKHLKHLLGPESIVVDRKGNWYTGLHDGRIVKITDGDKDTASVTDITESIDFAQGSTRRGKRPLGLRLVNNNLYFADAVQGLFVIDIETRKWEKIIAYDDVNPPMLFPDDLTITRDERTIYLTDVSTRWGYEQAAYSFIEGECSGRVFKVNIQTKSIETLFDGLCFANGIELDRAENNLLVSEFSRRRVVVLNIESRKLMKTILFPGGTDNIRRSKKGGYWVPIPLLHHASVDFMIHYPFIRVIVTNLFSSERIAKLLKIGPGAIVKLNEDFDPVRIHYDMDGEISQIVTEVTELENGDLLLGSFQAFGIAKINGQAMEPNS